MEDYLDLIKNPKRQSNNAPIQTPSNRPRASSPIPTNTSGSSTNPSYINKLDKIRAVNLKTWGNQNQNVQNPAPSNIFPSNRQASLDNRYIPSQNSINQEALYVPSTHIQKSISPTAASSNYLFGQSNPSYQPSNLFGQYIPSNTKPLLFPPDKPIEERNNPSLSPVLKPKTGIATGQERQNRFQPSPESSLSGSKPTLFGTGNFGNDVSNRFSSYTQDSLTRKFSNPKKDSSLSDQSLRSQKSKVSSGTQRDKSPIYKSNHQSRERSHSSAPRSGKSKNYFETPLILLGILVLVLVIAATDLLSPLKKPKFCDTDNFVQKDCVPCPEHGTCENGVLKNCEGIYQINNNKCIKNPEIDARYSKFRKYINSLLALKKGEKQFCNHSEKDYLDLDQIREELKKRFPGEKDLLNSNIPSFFKNDWDDYFREDEGLIYKEEVYYTKDDPNPSFSCKMKYLWREGRIFGLWVVLLIFSVALSVRLITRHIIYSRLGSEMYDDIIGHLSYWKSCSVKSLKKEFDHKYPGKNFERIWKYVEKLRKKEAKIYQYFDTYQGLAQEFWLLKH